MIRWLRNRELAPLTAQALIAISIWAFIAISGAATEYDTTAFDRTLLLSLRNPADINQPLGDATIQETARDITALAGVFVLSLVTLSVAGYLMLVRHYRVILLMLVAVGGGALLSMLSAVPYLTLGALLARLQPRRLLKAYLLGLALLLTLLIGLSRVYLAVHWPTDVLAGWTAGAAWAMLCWMVARWLQRAQMERTLDAPLEDGSHMP